MATAPFFPHRFGKKSDMKSWRLTLSIVVFIQYLSFAQLPGDFYKIDVSHSLLQFKIQHVGFGGVTGNFNDYSGVIYLNPDNLLETSASVIISVESIDTRSARDANLREYFFQAEKNPYLTFYSIGTIQKEEQYFLQGNLTVGEVTKVVDIPFTLDAGPIKDQFKHIRIALSGGFTINRKDYGIYYRTVDFWDNIIADSVFIELEIGAKIYNSIETVFPFRENSIGRLCYEAYQEGGIEAAQKKATEVLADPENHLISVGQMIRGVTHLAQSGNTEGALELLDLGILLYEKDMKPGDKAKFLSVKAKHLAKLGRYTESRKNAEDALKDDSLNVLALEVLKQVVGDK